MTNSGTRTRTTRSITILKNGVYSGKIYILKISIERRYLSIPNAFQKDFYQRNTPRTLSSKRDSFAFSTLIDIMSLDKGIYLKEKSVLHHCWWSDKSRVNISGDKVKLSLTISEWLINNSKCDYPVELVFENNPFAHQVQIHSVEMNTCNPSYLRVRKDINKHPYQSKWTQTVTNSLFQQVRYPLRAQQRNSGYSYICMRANGTRRYVKRSYSIWIASSLILGT